MKYGLPRTRPIRHEMISLSCRLEGDDVLLATKNVSAETKPNDQSMLVSKIRAILAQEHLNITLEASKYEGDSDEKDSASRSSVTSKNEHLDTPQKKKTVRFADNERMYGDTERVSLKECKDTWYSGSEIQSFEESAEFESREIANRRFGRRLDSTLSKLHIAICKASNRNETLKLSQHDLNRIHKSLRDTTIGLERRVVSRIAQDSKARVNTVQQAVVMMQQHDESTVRAVSERFSLPSKLLAQIIAQPSLTTGRKK